MERTSIPKARWAVVAILAGAIAYLCLWPVPVQPVAWQAAVAPGYAGAHAQNMRLTGLRTIGIGAETGPEHIALGPDGKLAPFLKPKAGTIDACALKARYSIKDCDVLLDGATSTMTFSLVEKARTTDERLLATEEPQVELLPRNQWGGLSSHLPDLVAAFVQPNDLAYRV